MLIHLKTFRINIEFSWKKGSNIVCTLNHDESEKIYLVVLTLCVQSLLAVVQGRVL